MVASQEQARNAPPDQRHDVLPGFGEWPKVQDTPVGSSALHPDGDGVSDERDDDQAAREFHISPSIVAAEPSIVTGSSSGRQWEDGYLVPLLAV